MDSAEMSNQDNKVAKVEMAFHCFDVINSHLNAMDIPIDIPFSNDNYPIFVTWKIGTDQQLRGCIGTFADLPLHTGIREYALSSAFKDSRFDPISKDELPSLYVAVSLLHKFEEGNDHLDWEVGKHGIKIEFMNSKGRKRSATYLPDYASTFGSDKIKAIDSLLRKGGYRDKITPEFRLTIKLTRYQSDIVHASHSDYLLHCQKREEQQIQKQQTLITSKA